MKIFSLTSLIFLFVTNLPLFAVQTIRTQILDQDASFERIVGVNGDASVVFNWSEDAIEERLYMLEMSESEPGTENIDWTFQILLPTWRGEKYQVTGYESTRGNEISSQELTDILDSKLRIWNNKVSGELDNNGIYTSPVYENQRIVFREMAGSIVEIFPFEKEENRWYTLSSISFSAEKEDVPVEERPESLSPSFIEAYRQFFTQDELDEIGTASSSGGYLVITHNIYVENLEPWIEWKRQSGYPVDVIEVMNNPSFEFVAGEIEDYYWEADVKPEFLLLVGDPTAGQNYHMPGDYIESEHSGWVVTDHSYTLLEGEDIWPELWVGRFSITTNTDALKIGSKTIAYESGTSLVDEAGWVNKGLMICDATYSSTGLTSSWVRREMLTYGFSEVDSIFAPPTFFAEPITNAINEGVGWVNYRGFGSPQSWQFPLFTSLDALNLSNGDFTPIITSIVCGGGQFDDEDDPCLGEAFLRAGTVNAPTGAVAFIGPSELDTHTRWNNCLDMGLYHGILHENITMFAAAVFRGKMAVWNGFPNNRDEGFEDESAWFYFFTYNIQGDPGLKIRTDIPVQLSLDVRDTLAFESNDLPVIVTDGTGSPVEGITVSLVTGTYEDGWGPYSMVTGADGMARFNLTNDLPPEGEMTVTALGFNTIAAIETINVVSGDLSLALDDLILDTTPVPGATVELTPVLRNAGEADAWIFNGTLEAVEGGVNVVQEQLAYDDTIEVGDTYQDQSFEIEIPVDAEDGFDPGLILTLEVEENETTVRLPLQVTASRLVCLGPVDNPEDPGDMVNENWIFENIGSYQSDQAVITITSEHPDLTIVDDVVDLFQVDSGESSETAEQLVVEVSELAYPGLPLPVNWTAAMENGRIESGTVNIIPGVPEVDDPYGPDNYGYMAFDDEDLDYWNAPSWEWMEIDPVYGGNGTSLDLSDYGDEMDESEAVNLPFDFTFYGETFDVVTICSNGWLKMGDTGEINFRNWNLPDGPGPMNLIAPFWDDLYRSEGTVSWYYDELRDRFIVEWSRMRLLHDANPNHRNTFQAILYNPETRLTPTGDGEIEFVYLEINDDDSQQNYSTIGIRNHNGLDGLELRYASHSPDPVAELDDGRVYRITTARRPEGAAVRITNFLFADNGIYGSVGNGDGNLNNGETIAFPVTIRNYGQEVADGVTVTIESDDPYVTIEEATVEIGTIPVQETVTLQAGLLATIAYEAPNGHFASLRFVFEIEGGEQWIESRSLDVFAPRLVATSVEMFDDEPEGNNNGFIEPGELVELEIIVGNYGRQGVMLTMATLNSDDEYVELLTNTALVDTLAPGIHRDLERRLTFRLAEDCPEYRNLVMPLSFHNPNGDLEADTLRIRTGYFPFYETFDTGQINDWMMVLGQWHSSAVDYYSPSHSLRWGDVTGNYYEPNSFDRAMTDYFTLDGPAYIDYRCKYDLGFGDRVLLEVIAQGQHVLCDRIFEGTQLDWQFESLFIDAGNQPTNVVLSLYGQSNAEIEGTGFYIDDIAIYYGEVDVEENETGFLPESYALDGPHPNPFNSTARIKISLPEKTDVDIRMFDILGRETAVLANGELSAGVHYKNINADNLASGIYFIRFNAGPASYIKKAVLIR